MIGIQTMLMAGAAAVSLLAAIPVQAADGATNKGNTVSKPTANSQDNYKYDRLFWDHAVPAWSYSELQGNESPTYCLPRSTVVIGQSAGLTSVAPKDGSDPDSGSKKKTDTKTEGQFLEVIVNPAHEFGWGVFGTKDRAEAQEYLNDVKNQPVCDGVDSPATLPLDSPLYVKTDNALRFGWEYGALVVPFKMQLGGKHAFTGSASVGAYLGYSVPIWDTGLVISPVGFAGTSNISVPSSGAKKDNTQTMAGLSYGFGLITRVKDGFQVGVIFGKDHVDSRNYLYNDKTWVSIEIGYSFAQ